jgi:hypothetical protein
MLAHFWPGNDRDGVRRATAARRRPAEAWNRPALGGVRYCTCLSTQRPCCPTPLLAASLPPPSSAAPFRLSACGGNEARVAPPVPTAAQGPSDAEQVRDVAKAITQAYADEDYSRLCAQFAPGTFTELIALAKVDNCEALFAKAPTFSAPSPQQINRADARIRGDRATLVFDEQGVEPFTLRRIDGRWQIANDAELSEG